MDTILKKGFQELGLPLSKKAISAFLRYYELLYEANQVMNLTAITEKDEVAQLHFLDSVSLLTLADFTGKTVIDVGTGAGFPGLPLKIADESIDLTLLDALDKRVGFLSKVCAEIGLSGVECIHARAEEAANEPLYREMFDIAVSRAVAKLNVLCELCIPYVKKGGLFIAMKSIGSSEETQEAEHAARILGATIEKVCDYGIAGTDIVHRAVLIRKIQETPIRVSEKECENQKNASLMFHVKHTTPPT